ncbi:MAG TPA: hypothetical protein VH120_03295 [Gemmataceae bacterium]|jgi:hypothetical protein|nr:hypothetical protein [Gemmataceae bacterium]
MPRFAVAAVVFAAFAVLSSAQDTTWEAPKPPEGWRSVISKDGTYVFAVPTAPGRTGTRERTLSFGGVRTRVLINYCQLKDGPLLEVHMESLSGPSLRGLTVGDALKGCIDSEKEEGFKVSEPKDVMVGDIKAKEYRLSKDTINRRLIIFAVKPRIYMLNVAVEGDAAKLDGDLADTFLKSLALVPAEVVKARAKERAAKDEQTGKENQEKYGFKWTTSLKEMIPPNEPVVGLIRGKEFKPDTVTLDPGNWLTFRQGVKGRYADIEVKLWLLPKAGESVENKTYEIGPAGAKAGESTPHVEIATMAENARIPQRQSFLNKYALKLSLGAKGADGSIPGTIYLCTPDANKSFLAGQFAAKAK